MTLEARLQQAAQLFEQSPTAAALLDAQGRVVRVNGRGCELLGAPAPGLVGRLFGSLLHASSQGTLTTLLERARRLETRQTGMVQTGIGPTGMGQHSGPDGRDLLLEVVLHPSGSMDTPYHLTLTDVTDFKGAHRHLLNLTQMQEQRLEWSQVRLRQSNEEFEQVMTLSRQHLQERLTRAGNFLGQGGQGRHDANLEHASDALNQMQNLLDSLDHYMRTRFLRTRVRRVDLAQVWREVLKELQPQLQNRDVQITGAALPAVQGDSQVLQIILSEYLINALKFTRTREQTCLRLIVEETPTEYRIGLEDNGVGFNMRYKDRAFALFGRLHTSALYEGTGLGLSVVRRLCERFGGRAWGEGKVDQGATFWFSWLKGAENE